MAKSRLQKEYEKELRLLERRIKALQRKAQSTFNPKEIEAVTRRKTRPTKKEVARIKALRGEELKVRLSRSTKLEPPKGKRLPQISRVEVRTPRETLPEDLKRERKNFRARVRRLEKQGFDTSQLKRASEYTLEELKTLKNKKLSEKAYKGSRTAYDIRKEKATSKRKETIETKEQRKRFNEIQRKADQDYVRPTEAPNLPTAPTMIDYLTNIFEGLENHNGVDIREDKATLLSLWRSILSRLGYPNPSDELEEYDNYLETQESDISPKCVQIEWDSVSERVSACFTNLFWILEKYQPLTQEESRNISDITERMTYSDVD